jgi:hypothetical protein
VRFAISANGLYILTAFSLFWVMTRGLARLVSQDERPR